VWKCDFSDIYFDSYPHTMQLTPLRTTAPVDWRRMLDEDKLFEHVNDQPGGGHYNGYDDSLHTMSSSHLDKMT
jgi:hypothetical protein